MQRIGVGKDARSSLSKSKLLRRAASRNQVHTGAENNNNNNNGKGLTFTAAIAGAHNNNNNNNNTQTQERGSGDNEFGGVRSSTGGTGQGTGSCDMISVVSGDSGRSGRSRESGASDLGNYEIWKREVYDKTCIELEDELKTIIGYGDLPCDVSIWTVNHVCNWLMNLGLSSYDADFEYEEINGEKLLKMHVQDISEVMSKKNKADVNYLRNKLHELKKAV